MSNKRSDSISDWAVKKTIQLLLRRFETAMQGKLTGDRANNQRIYSEVSNDLVDCFVRSHDLLIDTLYERYPEEFAARAYQGIKAGALKRNELTRASRQASQAR